MIITIARQCGCSGDKIGQALAEKYKIPFFDKEGIKKIAKEKGLLEKYPYFYGEMPLDTLIYSESENDPDSPLKKTPKVALAELIGNEECVVVGRCGNYAFKDREDIVSVFLCGKKENRIDAIAESHNVNFRKAKKIVEETDARRLTYHKYYTGEEWGFAGNYDLCLNIAKIGEEATIITIDKFVETL